MLVKGNVVAQVQAAVALRRRRKTGDTGNWSSSSVAGLSPLLPSVPRVLRRSLMRRSCPRRTVILKATARTLTRFESVSWRY